MIEKLKTMEIDSEWKDKLINAAKISDEIEPEITWSRYPAIDRGELWGPYEEYSIDDAVEIRGKAEIVIKIAKGFIQWWFKE